MKAIIRQANIIDATPLAQFAEHSFREAFSSENLATNIDMHCLQSFCSEIQQEEILNSNIVTFLAEIENTLVGYAQLRHESYVDCIKSSRPVELYRLYVSNKHHGSGLAHQLMKEVLSTASNANSDCIWLGVWEHNPRAIKFYQKYDFSRVGEHIFNLGRDPQRDLIMAAKVEGAVYGQNRQ